jgi:FkbM family methyltransferase
MLCFDIGANRGDFTVAALEKGYDVVAVEAAPKVFGELVGNFIYNPRVTPLKFAVSGSDYQRVEFYEAEEDGLSTLNEGWLTDPELPYAGKPYRTTAATTITLDKLALLYGTPDLIKIDVEGWEMSVLSGAEKILSQKSLLAIILEINGRGQDLGVTDEKIVNHLMSYEFLAYRYDPLTRKISKITGRNFDGGNTIFIRNIDECRNRIQASPTFRVMGVDL